METEVVAVLFAFYPNRTLTPTIFSFLFLNTLTPTMEFVDGLGCSICCGVGLGLGLRLNCKILIVEWVLLIW